MRSYVWATVVLLVLLGGLAEPCPVAAQSRTTAKAGPAKPARLTGRLKTSDGKPASGIVLTVVPLGGRGGLSEKDSRKATTGADGTFAVTVATASQYYVFWEATATFKEGTVVAPRKGTSLGSLLARLRATTGPEFNGSVGRSVDTKCDDLTNFAMDAQGNLLLCDTKSKVVKVVSQDDRLVAAWTMPFGPQAVDACEDGTVLVAGEGKVARLDAGGKVTAEGSVPGSKAEVTAIGHSGDDVFVCSQAPSGFIVSRLNAQLADGTTVINGLSGCCGQLDIKARDGRIYIAENARFAIGIYDRDGKLVMRHTKNDPKAAEYYGEGCCEPKNICFGPDGTIYASSSGKMMVQRYGLDGKYLGQVAHVPSSDGSCVRVAIAVTADGSKLYMLDTDNGLVRVLKPKQAVAR